MTVVSYRDLFGLTVWSTASGFHVVEATLPPPPPMLFGLLTRRRSESFFLRSGGTGVGSSFSFCLFFGGNKRQFAKIKLQGRRLTELAKANILPVGVSFF